VALTFADYLHKSNEDARRFEQLDRDDIQFIEQVERVAAAPVSLISTRFDFRSIIDRRKMVGGVTPAELAKHYPRLYHMAEGAAGPAYNGTVFSVPTPCLTYSK